MVSPTVVLSEKDVLKWVKGMFSADMVTYAYSMMRIKQVVASDMGLLFLKEHFVLDMLLGDAANASSATRSFSIGAIVDAISTVRGRSLLTFEMVERIGALRDDRNPAISGWAFTAMNIIGTQVPHLLGSTLPNGQKLPSSYIYGRFNVGAGAAVPH